MGRCRMSPRQPTSPALVPETIVIDHGKIYVGSI
jgi:hypothetical protein